MKIALVLLNDLHGYLEPHAETFRPGGRAEVREAGGLARISAILSNVRQEYRGACLVLDGGDSIHGTPEALFTEGAVIPPLLNAFGIQAAAPGNWEYGYGWETLKARIGESDYPWLAANAAVADESPFEGGRVFEVGGHGVGVVGLSSDLVGKTMSKKLAPDVTFEDPVEALNEEAGRLRSEGAEVVVALSHLGLPQEWAVAEEVEGVDVILGAHTHDRLEHPVRAEDGPPIVQAGCHGSFLGKLVLEVDAGGASVEEYELIEVSEKIAEDPEMDARVREAAEPWSEELDEVVGETEVLLHRDEALESPMDDLLTEAYRTVAESEISLQFGWRFGAPVPPGPVRLRDVYQMAPQKLPLHRGTVREAALREFLEGNLERVFSRDYLYQAGGHAQRICGLTVGFRVQNPPGARIRGMAVNGEPLREEQEYSVAYAGELPKSLLEGMEEVEPVAQDALVGYLESHGPWRGRREPGYIPV